jgi:hypothetical protein
LHQLPVPAHDDDHTSSSADRNLNGELWLGMLFVDLLETTLNLQQNRAFVVTFSATQTNFTWYVSYHEIVAVSPINVLDSALFKIGTTTDVATFFNTHSLSSQSRVSHFFY